MERMLIVDDTPFKCQYNYGNAIYPEEFNGEAADDELHWLGLYLESIAHRANYRSLEKRWWKENIKGKH